MSCGRSIREMYEVEPLVHLTCLLHGRLGLPSGRVATVQPCLASGVNAWKA